MKNVSPMIHVPDVESTAKWYESIGFAIEDIGRENGDEGEAVFALLSFGRGSVMLSSGGRPSAAERREVDLYVTVDDVDALYAEIKDRVEVVRELDDAFYGMREFIIRDCNRFWITFGERVS